MEKNKSEIYRTCLLTCQEHKLSGTTMEEKYCAQPYKPLAVIDNEITVERCDELRQNQEKSALHGIIVRYWGIKGLLGTARLERLNLDTMSPYYGDTLQDPTLVEVYDYPNAHLFDRRSKFPFKRNEPRIELAEKVLNPESNNDFLSENSVKLIKNILRNSCNFVKDKFKRYWGPEIAGTLTAYTSAYLAKHSLDIQAPIALGYIITMGENLGFYGTMIKKQIKEDSSLAKQLGRNYGLREIGKTLSNITAEFGPAELTDSFLIRPAAMASGEKLLGTAVGVGAGKLLADAIFYIQAGIMHEIIKKRSYKGI